MEENKILSAEEILANAKRYANQSAMIDVNENNCDYRDVYPEWYDFHLKGGIKNYAAQFKHQAQSHEQSKPVFQENQIQAIINNIWQSAKNKADKTTVLTEAFKYLKELYVENRFYCCESQCLKCELVENAENWEKPQPTSLTDDDIEKAWNKNCRGSGGYKDWMYKSDFIQAINQLKAALTNRHQEKSLGEASEEKVH